MTAPRPSSLTAQEKAKAAEYFEARRLRQRDVWVPMWRSWMVEP